MSRFVNEKIIAVLRNAGSATFYNHPQSTNPLSERSSNPVVGAEGRVLHLVSRFQAFEVTLNPMPVHLKIDDSRQKRLSIATFQVTCNLRTAFRKIDASRNVALDNIFEWVSILCLICQGFFGALEG